MNGERNKKLVILFVLSVSLIATALTTIFLSNYYSRTQFQILGNFCEEIMEEHPDCKQTILEILKTKKLYAIASTDENILRSFGYQQSDFLRANVEIFLVASAGFVAGSALFLFAFWYWHRNMASRIRMLTDYLEKINTGGQGLLFGTSEDEFSRLQDEIYKTNVIKLS